VVIVAGQQAARDRPHEKGDKDSGEMPWWQDAPALSA
jgi:hypothetical protein